MNRAGWDLFSTFEFQFQSVFPRSETFFCSASDVHHNHHHHFKAAVFLLHGNSSGTSGNNGSIQLHAPATSAERLLILLFLLLILIFFLLILIFFFFIFSWTSPRKCYECIFSPRGSDVVVVEFQGRCPQGGRGCYGNDVYRFVDILIIYRMLMLIGCNLILCIYNVNAMCNVSIQGYTVLFCFFRIYQMIAKRW